MNIKKIENKVQSFYASESALECVYWLIKKFDLHVQANIDFEFTENAAPEFILMTTEGDFGESQKIKIPKNAFEYQLPLILNLLTHEIVHVVQRTTLPFVLDKNEREWQAYYEILFHKMFPKIPDCSTFHQQFFAKKALEYYNRMGEGSALQEKYVFEKTQVEQLIQEGFLEKK
jgi:hypothetical protein